jgi:hypothetical protein
MGLGMSGPGACAPVVPEPPEEAVPDREVADAPQVAAAEALADEATDWVAPAVPFAELPLGVLPGADDVLSVVCVPLPSVPCPPCCEPLPPSSTVELAWMIAWRKGWTPSDTLAMTAIPASTITGRSQPTFQSGSTRVIPPSAAAPSGTSRIRGSGRCAGLGSASGHAQ